MSLTEEQAQIAQQLADMMWESPSTGSVIVANAMCIALEQIGGEVVQFSFGPGDNDDGSENPPNLTVAVARNNSAPDLYEAARAIGSE